MINYEIHWLTPSGQLIGMWSDAKKETTFNRLELVYGKGVVGALSLIVPDKDYPPSVFASNQIFEVYRVVDGRRNLEGERIWKVRQFYFDDTSKTWTFAALDNNDDLDGRVIAYKATTSQAQKTDYLDDMIKDLVRENLGSSATDTDRVVTSVTVQSDSGSAPSKTKSFSYRNLLLTINELCGLSASAGTYLTYDFVRTGRGTVEFRTFTGQRGSDFTGSNKRIISPDMKNLANGLLNFDYTKERNTCYVGGQGENTDRVVVEVEDTTASKRDIWARRESFEDARHITDDTSGELTNIGKENLYENRPKVTLTGSIQEVEGSFRYGIDFNYGDKLTAQMKGYSFDAHIDKVHITVNPSSGLYESLDIKIRGEA